MATTDPGGRLLLAILGVCAHAYVFLSAAHRYAVLKGMQATRFQLGPLSITLTAVIRIQRGLLMLKACATLGSVFINARFVQWYVPIQALFFGAEHLSLCVPLCLRSEDATGSSDAGTQEGNHLVVSSGRAEARREGAFGAAAEGWQRGTLEAAPPLTSLHVPGTHLSVPLPSGHLAARAA